MFRGIESKGWSLIVKFGSSDPESVPRDVEKDCVDVPPRSIPLSPLTPLTPLTPLRPLTPLSPFGSLSPLGPLGPCAAKIARPRIRQSEPKPWQLTAVSFQTLRDRISAIPGGAAENKVSPGCRRTALENRAVIEKCWQIDHDQRPLLKIAGHYWQLLGHRDSLVVVGTSIRNVAARFAIQEAFEELEKLRVRCHDHAIYVFDLNTGAPGDIEPSQFGPLLPSVPTNSRVPPSFQSAMTNACEAAAALSDPACRDGKAEPEAALPTIDISSSAHGYRRVQLVAADQSAIRIRVTGDDVAFFQQKKPAWALKSADGSVHEFVFDLNVAGIGNVSREHGELDFRASPDGSGHL